MGRAGFLRYYGGMIMDVKITDEGMHSNLSGEVAITCIDITDDDTVWTLRSYVDPEVEKILLNIAANLRFRMLIETVNESKLPGRVKRAALKALNECLLEPG